MTGPIELRNGMDAYIDQATPSKNYNSLGRMYLQDGAFGYLFFSRPFPLGATIVSAKLVIRQGNDWPYANLQMNAYRTLSKWSASSINWNRRVIATTSNGATLYKSNTKARDTWEFDITAMMQDVSNGVPWYGIRLDVNGTVRKWIYSLQTNATYLRPKIVIEWSDAPDDPTELRPANGSLVSIAKPTLLFDFVDISGDRSMGGYQLQMNPTNLFTAPAFDTGVVVSSEPQCDLTETSYPGLAEGDVVWWRVRVRDGAGLWSGWSTPVSFLREAKGVVTIVSPAGGVVEESTPPIVWSFSKVQEQYRLIIRDAETLISVWDSGIVTSDANERAIPSGVLKTVGKAYIAEIRVWDSVDRVATPGDTPYVALEVPFVFEPQGIPSPVSALTVTQDGFYPWFDLTWEDATAADSYMILRNGVVVGTGITSDLLSGGLYRFRDRLVPGREEATWKVVRVVNGQASDGPSITKKIRYVAPWLSESDGSNAILLMNPSISVGLAEVSEVAYPIEGPPVLIMQSLGGFSGEVQGTLADGIIPGLTSKEMKRRFLDMRDRSGIKLNFHWADEAVECHIYGTQLTSVPRHDGGTDYEVSFNFIEARD